LHYLPVIAIKGLIFWWERFFILDNESNLSIPILYGFKSKEREIEEKRVESTTIIKE